MELVNEQKRVNNQQHETIMQLINQFSLITNKTGMSNSINQISSKNNIDHHQTSNFVENNYDMRV